MKVRFVAALADSSGYSEASRNYLCALDTLVRKEKIELAAINHKFETWATDIGSYRPMVDKYVGQKIEKPDLQIIHLTPDCFTANIDKSCKNAGYCAWETSKLPDKWVPLINQLSECWVPSAWNIEVFKNSGVNIPVYAIPHAVDVDSLLKRADGDGPDFKVPADKFAFYSIFQWTERKNPIGLLKAFFSEFNIKDQACLVLKTYLKAHGPGEREFIRNEISRIRESMFIKDAPPVIFIGGDLSSSEIACLHKRGDCLVFPTRAEGWGLCQFEAMAFGKPVITTNYSGHLDFCTDHNSYLTNYTLTPVSGMPWDKYTGRMSWAEPDLDHLKKQMRHVFENQVDAKIRGARAAEDVKRFNWEQVGSMMWDRMRAIVGGGR